MTLLRKDVKPGDCFVYASGTQGNKSWGGYKIYAYDPECRKPIVPVKWIAVSTRGGTGYPEDEVIIVPHWNGDITTSPSSKDYKSKEDKLIENYSTEMRWADLGRCVGILTPTERTEASLAWSASLREKIKASRHKEKNQVTVDWGDHWE